MASCSFRLTCALACIPLAGVAAAGGAVSSIAAAPPANLASASSGLSTYRAYASNQADMLARMTKVLARDIGSGDLAAAQNDYAVAHSYLGRIKAAVSKLNSDLDRRMDASVTGDPLRALDPSVSGFHRIEHDLFGSRSAEGLSIQADRLRDDALLLRTAIATQTMASEPLVDGAIETIETVSSRTNAGGSEPYARTDLWDIEANLEGAREIVAAIRPQIEARDPLLMARIANAFAKADERVSRYKAGCGFKSFDELTNADRTSLGEATATLARELSKLRSVPTVD